VGGTVMRKNKFFGHLVSGWTKIQSPPL
jgi:hypothetical protein